MLPFGVIFLASMFNFTANVLLWPQTNLLKTALFWAFLPKYTNPEIILRKSLVEDFSVLDGFSILSEAFRPDFTITRWYQFLFYFLFKMIIINKIKLEFLLIRLVYSIFITL